MITDRALRRFAAILLCIMTVACAGRPVAAAEPDDRAIAFVKTVTGTVTLVRDGASEPIRTGVPLREKDRIETGSDGSVGVTFRDNTRIALGPKSRIDLERFVFKPADKQYGFVLKLLRGTLEYISGLTGKLAPEAISIETPTSTIGVRGTRLLTRVEE
jgi:hypothetical protein